MVLDLTKKSREAIAVELEVVEQQEVLTADNGVTEKRPRPVFNSDAALVLPGRSPCGV
jgi:hypothetical protein